MVRSQMLEHVLCTTPTRSSAPGFAIGAYFPFIRLATHQPTCPPTHPPARLRPGHYYKIDIDLRLEQTPKVREETRVPHLKRALAYWALNHHGNRSAPALPARPLSNGDAACWAQEVAAAAVCARGRGPSTVSRRPKKKCRVRAKRRRKRKPTQDCVDRLKAALDTAVSDSDDFCSDNNDDVCPEEPESDAFSDRRKQAWLAEQHFKPGDSRPTYRQVFSHARHKAPPRF
jgi:hypothetical protein